MYSCAIIKRCYFPNPFCSYKVAPPEYPHAPAVEKYVAVDKSA